MLMSRMKMWLLLPGIMLLERNGPDPSGVLVFAFSESQDLFLADNPIESVVATGYNAANPMWVPTGSGEVRITPKSSLGGELFSQWLISGASYDRGQQCAAREPGHDRLGNCLL